MIPEQPILIKDMNSVRAAVQKYMVDNAGWMASERDLVWSQRYMVAKMALLAGKEMSFGELTQMVRTALDETSSEQIRFLTAELMAKTMCNPVGPILEPSPPASSDTNSPSS